MLRNEILQEYIKARKERNEVKRTILGLLKDAIEKKEKNENSNNPLEDIMTVQIITKVLKETKESLDYSIKANNNIERTENFKIQIKILEEFLPSMMSEEELKDFISKILIENSLSSKKDMGKVMSLVIPKLSGKADKSMISKVVQSLLT